MSTLKALRQKYEYTQEALANSIRVTKATLIAYEKDPSHIPAGIVSKLANIFEVDCDCIINNTEPRMYSYKVSKDNNSSDNHLRIDIPKRNIKKFKEAFLYILGKIGALPNVGKTVLYKILYFIDFDYYELYEEQLIGAKYIKNTFGPTPVDFARIIREMERDEELVVVKDKYFEKEQTKYLPRRSADLNLFNARELEHIDICLKKYGHMNATQISSLSHDDTPWIVAKMREPISYESVFYRTEKTSVRNYSNK